MGRLMKNDGLILIQHLDCIGIFDYAVVLFAIDCSTNDYSKAVERTSYALDMLLQLQNAARIYVLSTYWRGKQRRRPCFDDSAVLRQSST